MALAFSALVGLIVLILSIPVGVALLIIPMLFLAIDPQAPMTVLPQKFFGAIDSFPLMAVPFFVLVGQVMNQGGVTDRIFTFANSLIGHVRGGLAQVNILASLLMSGMSGSSVADAAGLGQVEINVMKKEGYTPAFSAAVTASSATIGAIIPPSIALVLVGAITGTSISQLLLAGILPGLLMSLAMFAVVGWVAVRRNFPTKPAASIKEILSTFLAALPALLAPVVLLGGILGGIFTPTEASAVAALYAIGVAMFIYRELDVRGLMKALYDTSISVAAIFFLIGTAGTLSWVMTWTNVPQALAAGLGGITDEPWLLLMIMMIMLLGIGLFLESNAALILVAPLLFPIATDMGMDPVHFGVVVVFALVIGLITPPVGMCMFITMAIAKITMPQFLAEAWRFILILFVTLLLIAYIPWLTLAIPTAVFR